MILVTTELIVISRRDKVDSSSPVSNILRRGLFSVLKIVCVIIFQVTRKQSAENVTYLNKFSFKDHKNFEDSLKRKG